jgi:hypothetical protein
MPTFIFAHRAPNGFSGSPDVGQHWADWFKRLGSNLVDPGNSVVERTTV